ncbi:50S ribosomal protein L11 methyltransferase [Sphingomonas sp. HMP6]|uniref:50S ribosomal protein L11 methyltransferase n=1 Tax=Sphingomonas sp. HMP6 TaxID=1517551 RepID=UPI001596DFF1|nr:50S ribosomal protein L11 methyltransferase [Sphingomonas sp. HMP6]
MRDRAQELLGLCALVEGQPMAMMALARQLAGAGHRDRALDLAARALALAPGDGEVRALATEVLSDGVPLWHFSIVRDQVRNAAYDAALRRAVFPGCTVLEIGTGSGLLAMMAARAGAGRVVTCEADPAVAAAARATIGRNGFADRITVLTAHSTALDPSEICGPADILVSEIVSNDMVSEGALPAHADAVPRLLKPGGTVIPVRGRMRIALMDDGGSVQPDLTEIDSFDLSPFNRLRRPYREIPVGNASITLRSDAADLFAFDFARGPWHGARTHMLLRSRGGRVRGVVQWIALDLDDETLYENMPAPSASSCWAAIFWPFVEPLATVPGEAVAIAACHEGNRVRLWRELHPKH